MNVNTIRSIFKHYNSDRFIKNVIVNQQFPNYTPPPEFRDLFPCKACGDKFVLESSHKFHLNRKSLLIEYKCETCNVLLEFKNRCALLDHIISHDEDTVIPEGALKVIPLISRVEDTPQPEMIIEDVIKNDSSSIELNLQRLYNRCHFCSKDMPSEKSKILGHFQNKRMNSQNLLCSICSKVLPNLCAFGAHHTLHTSNPPFICPECGTHFDSLDHLQEHASETCHHDDRLPYLNCIVPTCRRVLKAPKIKSHFFEKHMKLVYPCRDCSYTTTLDQNLINHYRIAHVSDKIEDVNRLKPMYECNFCQTHLNLKSMDAHIREHSLLHKQTYYYTCRGCWYLIKSLDPFKEHIAECEAYKKIMNKKKDECNLPQSPSLIAEENDRERSPSISPTRSPPASPHEPNQSVIKETTKIDHKDDSKTDKVLSGNDIVTQISTPVPDQQVVNTKEKDQIYICRKCTKRFTKKSDFLNHIIKENNCHITYNKKKNKKTKNEMNLTYVKPLTIADPANLLVPRPSRKRKKILPKQKQSPAKIKPPESTPLPVVTKVNVNRINIEIDTPPELVEPKVETPVQVNFCPICNESFEDSIDLAKHFRTHGMAFLMQNKQNVI